MKLFQPTFAVLLLLFGVLSANAQATREQPLPPPTFVTPINDARVVFPAALSGVVAGLVLGASRAIGETILILVAAGNNPNLTFDLGVAHQNMAAFIANTARADISAGGVAYGTIFAVGGTLFIITFSLNLFAIRFVRKYRQVYD